MIDKTKYLDCVLPQTVPNDRGLSRSELLLILQRFHEQLDAFFEDIRTVPGYGRESRPGAADEHPPGRPCADSPLKLDVERAG